MPQLLLYKTFEEYADKTKTEITLFETEPSLKELMDDGTLVTWHQYLIPHGIPVPDESIQVAQWGILRGKRCMMNKEAKRLFEYTYENLRKAAGV